MKQKFHWFVKLPKGCKSPTNSIYKRHDIVSQTYALWAGTGESVIRSLGPFVLSVQMPSGKIKELVAKDDR